MSPPARSVAYQRPPLTGYQLAAMFTAHRYAVVEATTKAGKTTACLVWLVEQAMRCQDGENVWWVAPILAQSKIAFRRMKRALPRALYTSSKSDLTITLINGVTIWFKGADHPDSLYGDDVKAAVIDEASRCKEDSWHAIRTTLTATRGKLRIIGNVRGRKNWAYKLARRAESGQPDMHYAKITANDAVAAGILDAAEIEDARRLLPEYVFRELYLAEASDDGANPFGMKAIGDAVTTALSTAPVVAFGIDLAKSHDWTVIVGLDAQGRVAYFARFQKSWEDTIDTIVKVVGAIPTLVDSTGVGDPVLESLQKRSRDAGGQIEGLKFTSSSKQQLMEGLAVEIQQQGVSFPDTTREIPLRLELDQFEYQYTRTGVLYSAPEGAFDDCVCALALAVKMRNTPQSGWLEYIRQQQAKKKMEAEAKATAAGVQALKRAA